MGSGGESGVDWLALIKNERRLEDGRLYGEVVEAWQLDLDRALIEEERCYIEMPRGHDKTGRLASHALCWLLDGEGKVGYAAGVDRDNARLFRTEIKGQADRNPRAFGDIDIFNYQVVNRRNGNTLDILSSDAPSSIGLKFTLLLINDFADWKSREFFEVLMSATGKIPNVRVWIESNAGRSKRGYKWNFREYCRQNRARWYFRTTKRWLAGWTDKAWFREQRAVLTPSAYRRLILNEWAADEDAFLAHDQVQAVTNPSLTPANARPEDVDLVAVASDLGISKAAAAVAAVGRVRGNRPARLLDLRVIPGSKLAPVQVQDVEEAIEDLRSAYDAQGVVVDPWNMRKTIQDRQAVWPIEEYQFSPATIMRLTSDVFRRVVSRQIELYPDAGAAIQNRERWTLQRELETAVIRQMPYGERIDHLRSGFTDRIIAVGMALWWIGKERLPLAPRQFGVRVLGG